MAKIICPDPHYQGTVCGLTFRNGVATTDNVDKIAFCRAAGYEIVDDLLPEPPPGNASQEVWAAWFIANVPGLDPEQVRAATRDELRALYAAVPEQQ
ncbi:hypothetical protein [Actinoplanes sp. NPDC049599]|uniref:hypothetical protein n=1 Tax=Actinoplanes sp. NPDC049599 TaxID=3363903 RepID=UPI0037A55D7F